MTDLIAELAEVSHLVNEACPGNYDSVAHRCATFLRTHAAEIEADKRDAERWREFCREVEMGEFPQAILNDAMEMGPGALDMHFDAAMRSAKGVVNG